MCSNLVFYWVEMFPDQDRQSLEGWMEGKFSISFVIFSLKSKQISVTGYDYNN